MKTNFDLEHFEFSEDSDNDMKLPCKSSMQMYNREYSLMLIQTRKFFADCKQCITRLLALNSMGFCLNLPLLLNTIFTMENKITNTNKSKDELLQSQKLKEKYEKSFYSILHRMSSVVDDLLELEVNIKRNYLGAKVNSPPMKRYFSINQELSGRQSESNSSHQLIKIIKKTIMDQQQKQDVENQEKIRGILKKSMTPSGSTLNKVCKQKANQLQNLEKLIAKTDMMKNTMKIDRQKEQKIWSTFNEKRQSTHSNNHIQTLSSTVGRKSFKLGEQLDTTTGDNIKSLKPQRKPSISIYCN